MGKESEGDLEISSKIKTYKLLVFKFRDQAKAGWKFRDEPTQFLSEIEDASITILRFGNQHEKEQFYQLLDDADFRDFVAGRLLAENSVPELVREKALEILSSGVKSGELWID